MLEFELRENEYEKICIYIKEVLDEGGTILLKGDLASGKTSLVKNFAKFLGVKEEVNSPTFNLQSIYDGVIYHYDLYTKSSKDFFDLGIFEDLEKKAYHFIEWADESIENFLNKIALDYIIINIKIHSKNKRLYEVRKNDS